MKHRPRILLADDHTMLLDAFRHLLEPRCEIVGAARDGRALVDLAVSTLPDVIVLDISMPRLNGIDACAQLSQKLPGTRFVFLTVNEDPDMAAEAIRLGGSGYLLKSSASAELFSAIENALEGKTYITPLVTKGVPIEVFLRRAEKPGVEKLTARQGEVLRLLAEGRAMKEVADFLDQQAQRTGFRVKLFADPVLERVDAAIETACFRVAQEALTNIIRHARAETVSLGLHRTAEVLHLVVRDDGIGFDVVTAHERARQGASLGLLGMRERVALLGGELDCKSAPGRGTEVHAFLPVRYQPDAQELRP
jgi:DNA-binding NarL/FixJ family response regulator